MIPCTWRTLDQDALETGEQVVGQAANGEEAIDLAFELQPDLITLDNILRYDWNRYSKSVTRKRASSRRW